jgi:hypothetical protein
MKVPAEFDCRKNTGIKGEHLGVRIKDTVWGYCTGKVPYSLHSQIFVIFFEFSSLLF